ncbi:MAG: TraB/GumN family protein [Pontixanthobacter sp.]
MKFSTSISCSVGAFAFALASPLQAQMDAATSEVVDAVEPSGPALWTVADEDTTIYLFGTVHALPEGIDWFSGDVADALASSDMLVTEIQVQPGSEAAMQQSFLAVGMLPEGESLRDLLDADQRAEFEGAMTDLGLPLAAFDRFEPWMAAVNLSLIPLLKAGYSPESGVEMLLEKAAAGKPRGELETVAYQMNLFDTLPIDTQIAYLIEAARQSEKIAGMMDAMVDEWVEGDPDGLAVMMNESFSDPVLAEALLYARNRNWAEWIDTRLDTPGTVFVAVGAGHLAGEQSVQDALAARGIATVRTQ